MHAHTYDYAVIRVVPKVERAEFVNAGVILSCPSLDYLDALIELAEARLLEDARQVVVREGAGVEGSGELERRVGEQVLHGGS